MKPRRDLQREALTYTAKPIRRIVLSFHEGEFRFALERLAAIMQAHRIESHTEAVLHLLRQGEDLDA